MCVTRAAPLAREVFALDVAPNLGPKAKAVQLLAWNPLATAWVAPKVEVKVVFVAKAPQLVGFTRKPWRLIVTVRVFRRSGMPSWIVGISPATVTRAVCGSTKMPVRATTVPRLKGPAIALTSMVIP